MSADDDFLAASLPAARREAFVDDWVRFHVEELDGLGDRLRWVEAHAGEAGAGERDEILAQLEAIVDAARLVRGAADSVWRGLARRPPAAPHDEDWFAPALLLLSLAPEDSRLPALLERLPVVARDTLRLAGREVGGR